MSRDGQPVILTYQGSSNGRTYGIAVPADMTAVGDRDHLLPQRAMISLTSQEMVDLARELLVMADRKERHG